MNLNYGRRVKVAVYHLFLLCFGGGGGVCNLNWGFKNF